MSNDFLDDFIGNIMKDLDIPEKEEKKRDSRGHKKKKKSRGKKRRSKKERDNDENAEENVEEEENGEKKSGQPDVQEYGDNTRFIQFLISQALNN